MDSTNIFPFLTIFAQNFYYFTQKRRGGGNRQYIELILSVINDG